MELDAVTAAIASAGLAESGNDLEMLAQAFDEDWNRFAPSDPDIGGSHMVSTKGNRTIETTGRSYDNTQLIQPGTVPAEYRPMSKRFMRGAPTMCCVVSETPTGYRVRTDMIRISPGACALLDHDAGVMTLLLRGAFLPETVREAAVGLLLGDVFDVPAMQDVKGLVIRSVRGPHAAEIRDGRRPWRSRLSDAMPEDPSLAIETAMPTWTTVRYTPVYVTRKSRRVPLAA